MAAGWMSRAVKWNRATVFWRFDKERWADFSPIRDPRRCLPEEKNVNHRMGPENGSFYIPSPIPARKKLMLDSCSFEYDASLRGIGS